jgi:hypothetical protein
MTINENGTMLEISINEEVTRLEKGINKIKEQNRKSD